MKQCQNIEKLIQDKKQVLNLYVDLLPQLEKAHGLEILHCDLRIGNIMSLDGNYVLIDWDLSYNTNQKQCLFGGSRYRNRPNSLCVENKCKNEYDDQVIWTPTHDFEMLNELIFRLYVSFFRFFVFLTFIFFIDIIIIIIIIVIIIIIIIISLV